MDDLLHSLGNAMPRLDTLKLDSVRSVLQEIEGHDEMHVENDPAADDLADTSMMDVCDLHEDSPVRLSKLDLELHPNELKQPDESRKEPAKEPAKEHSSANAAKMPNISGPEISTGPNRATAGSDTTKSVSAIHQEKDFSESKPHEAMSLGSVLHPTQLGAHKAVDTALEVNMPIPLPWHHNLPYLLSTYLQLAFNIFMVLVALWVFNIFRSDVNKRVDEQAAAIARSAATCATLYVENECRPGKVRPALQEYCIELEECMEKDPDAVRRLNANAATLAEIVNSFLDPLSWKSLFLLVTGGVLLAFAANYGFGFLRARMYYGISHPPAAEPARVSYRMTPLVIKRENVLKY